MLLGLIDRLTPLHLRALRDFATPASKVGGFHSKGLAEWHSWTSDILKLRTPLKEDFEFSQQIVRDLANCGLVVDLNDQHTLLNARITSLGKEFLTFISSPLGYLPKHCYYDHAGGASMKGWRRLPGGLHSAGRFQCTR